MLSNSSSNYKNHPKKAAGSRDRDKTKSGESGGSSQCDTPPHADKDASTSHGKFAGISAESVQCMAEQFGAEMNLEAATNLAEDVSYKLRQTINTIALHSGLMKKSRVDTWDVNSVLMLSDTSPVVGVNSAPYAIVGDEKICCQYENTVNVTDVAMTPQTYTYSTLPSVSVEWITDENSLSNSTNISGNLHSYYTKVAKAILNLKKKHKEIAVTDLATNTRIGPIFPNLFNLAVLVLNDDNLNALNVPAKKPLQTNVLEMVDALCSNPCSLDTNIQQQFQRLFPMMVSNILGNGSLADKMVAILTKITRTWPYFTSIGKTIVFDYLSQGTKERLTAPMIKCVAALGRQALIECIGEHLDHIDKGIHSQRKNLSQLDIRETILEASTCLLRSEPTTYLEDFVMTDYTLYEMLGDSILPRRTLFPADPIAKEAKDAEKQAEEEFMYLPLRPAMKRSRVKLLPTVNKKTNLIPRNAVFDPTKFSVKRKIIYIKVKSFRPREVRVRLSCTNRQTSDFEGRTFNSVIIASGGLDRFKYSLQKKDVAFPFYGALML